MISIDELRSVVRRRRRDLDMTQSSLARACGVSSNTICQFERGQKTTNVQTLLKMIERLGLELVIK